VAAGPSRVVQPAARRHAQVRREPAQALPGHLQRQLRLRATGAGLWEALRDVVLDWCGTACARSASTTRTRSRCRSGVADRRRARRVPRTRIFLAEAFTRPR
jgi:hypothetical protein